MKKIKIKLTLVISIVGSVILASLILFLVLVKLNVVTPNGQDALNQIGPIPSDKASDAEKTAFASRVQLLAQPASTVIVGRNCALSPSVFSLKYSSSLTFKNRDNVVHVLNTAQVIKLQPGAQFTIKKTIFKGSGIYGISCDGSSIVGYLNLF